MSLLLQVQKFSQCLISNQREKKIQRTDEIEEEPCRNKKWETPAVNYPEAKAASYRQELDIAEIKAEISVPCAEIYKLLSKKFYI